MKTKLKFAHSLSCSASWNIWVRLSTRVYCATSLIWNSLQCPSWRNLYSHTIGALFKLCVETGRKDALCLNTSSLRGSVMTKQLSELLNVEHTIPTLFWCFFGCFSYLKLIVGRDMLAITLPEFTRLVNGDEREFRVIRRYLFETFVAREVHGHVWVYVMNAEKT